MFCLIGESGEQFINNAGIAIGTKLIKSLIHQIPGKVLVEEQAMRLPPLLTQEVEPPSVLHARALDEPGLDGTNLVSPRMVGSGEATLEARDVEDAAVDCDMHQHQAAGYRGQEPMTKH